MVYCDSVILMFFLDASDDFHSLAAARLQAISNQGDELAVSDLTRLECRVKPMRLADAPRLAKFDAFFMLPNVRTVPLTSSAYDRATELRARHSFKTTDALHLAAAKEAGCGLFLTYDFRLARCTDIPVEILS